jgi:hypothetical protein
MTHADKTQETQKKSVANEVSQRHNGEDSTFQFVDNRPEAIAQRKLQEIANNSPQVKQIAQLQAMANNYSAKQELIQRKMVFGNDTEDLDASVKDNGITDSSFIKVQNRAKEIEPSIIIALNAPSTPEQAKFHPYGKGGLINVKPLPDKSDRDYSYAHTGRLIAVTHETQHALDHLDPDSPMKGELSQLTGEKGVRTELNAFAAQSAETKQLIDGKKTVERKLIDMANAFIDSTPDTPTELLLNIMKHYAWYYSNNYKKNNPDYGKVKDTPTLITTTKRYIALYLSESKAIYESLISE